MHACKAYGKWIALSKAHGFITHEEASTLQSGQTHPLREQVALQAKKALIALSDEFFPNCHLPVRLIQRICRALPDESLKALMQSCKSLWEKRTRILSQSVQLLSTYASQALLRDTSFGLLQVIAAQDEAQHSPYTLTFKESRPPLGLLEKFLETFDGLETLDLSNNQKIDDEWLIRVVSRCPNLKHLNLSGCKNITAHSFASLKLPEGLEQFTADDTKIDETGFKNLMDRCTKLVSLSLARCKGLMVDMVENFSYPKTLKTVDFSQSLLMADGAQKLLQEASTLQTLNLMGCVGISQASFLSLDWPQTLERLDLSRTHLTNPGLQHLFERAKALKEFTMKECIHLPLDDLDQPFPESLERLILDRNLGDLKRHDLFDKCSKLKQLSMQQCPELSTASYEVVKRYFLSGSNG